MLAPMRLLLALFLLIVSGAIHAQSPTSSAPKLYAVIFDVTLNSTGKVESLKVAKVIDPSTHTSDAVNVAVPDSYLSAAQQNVLLASLWCRSLNLAVTELDERPDSDCCCRHCKVMAEPAFR